MLSLCGGTSSRRQVSAGSSRPCDMRGAGVCRIIITATNLEESRAALQLARQDRAWRCWGRTGAWAGMAREG